MTKQIGRPKKISVRLREDQREWLDTKTDRSEYIRGLIDKDMVIK